MNNHSVVTATDLTKTYQRGREEVHALEAVSFTVHRGEFVAVTGPSGAGKTTLLNLIGCMDTPTRGTLHIGGRTAHELSERERTRLRREHLGFVFQHFSLLPTLTVAENVALPALFARRFAGARVDQLLDKVGLAHRRGHLPHELSGGEMQRAAIARALVNDPPLLLADEPTGNLDSATGETIIALFRKLQSEGLSIMVVTHNAALAAAAGRRLELRDGRVVAQVF
ncbi:MAG: ABC transporter ATP-binding protein [Verrucomicrobia bacterium]|nr:ABC transporter ATP-binding protein [Verrucomicrobiota bacterium]